MHSHSTYTWICMCCLAL